MGRTSNAKDRLIETAVGLIRARSYTAVSVDDLCRHAGVRKGSFYHFFPSKRDLALAAMDAWWNGTRTEVLEPAFQPDVPPLQRIERAFRRAVAQQSRIQERTGRFQGCPFGNLAQELSTQDEVVREKLSATFAGSCRRTPT
jgi:TetR/AcrR family transcriptional repressor of nem operon